MIWGEKSVKSRANQVLFTIQPMSEFDKIKSTGMVRGERGQHYVGLRESAEQAFERAKYFNDEIRPEDCLLIRCDFTPTGWLYCTTQKSGTIPMLYHKNFANSPLAWGTWHFNGALPVVMHDADTNEVLMTVTFHQFPADTKEVMMADMDLSMH